LKSWRKKERVEGEKSEETLEEERELRLWAEVEGKGASGNKKE
jgi:hypothetical protein